MLICKIEFTTKRGFENAGRSVFGEFVGSILSGRLWLEFGASEVLLARRFPYFYSFWRYRFYKSGASLGLLGASWGWILASSIQFNSTFNSINSIQFNFNSIQFNSIQFNSIQFNSIQFNSSQFNSVQFNSIQFNSIDVRIQPRRRPGGQNSAQEALRTP